MELTRLFLARHGEVANHHELRFNGHFDVDITDRGVEQMKRLAGFLVEREIDAIYSSDLQRAYKGAEIIAGRLGIEYEKVPSLREVNLGRWEGLNMEEVRARYPDEAKFRFRDLAHYRVKGGENLLDLNERVMPAINELIKKHTGKNIFVIAHGGVNRAILCNVLHLPLTQFFRIEQDYGCLNIIDYFEDVEFAKLINGGPNQLLKPTVFY